MTDADLLMRHLAAKLAGADAPPDDDDELGAMLWHEAETDLLAIAGQLRRKKISAPDAFKRLEPIVKWASQSWRCDS